MLAELLWAQRQRARGEANVPCDPLSPPLPAAPSLPLGPLAARAEQGSWLPRALASAGPTPGCPGVIARCHLTSASRGLGDAQQVGSTKPHAHLRCPPSRVFPPFSCPLGSVTVLGRAGATAEHTHGDVPAVGQAPTEGQRHCVCCVCSGLWLLLGVAVPQGLQAVRCTLLPGPQPTVAGDERTNRDMNRRRRLGGGPGPCYPTPGPTGLDPKTPWSPEPGHLWGK